MTTVSGKLLHTFTILLVKTYFLKSYLVLCVSNLYRFPRVIVDKFNFYRAMHLSAYARSWDRMSSVCDVGGL